MDTNYFTVWLGNLFGEAPEEVNTLLKSEFALQFLITWSLFEAKCFSGFAKLDKFDDVALKVSNDGSLDIASTESIAKYFHDRYQDVNYFDRLMHSHKCERMSKLLRKTFDNLNLEEKLYLLLVTVFRFRNNMFHGNKGVNSWLQYEEQINNCIVVMQTFITFYETLTPTLKLTK